MLDARNLFFKERNITDTLISLTCYIMVDENLLQEYSESIRRLKRQCLEAGMSDEEFRKLYFESLKSLEARDSPESQSHLRFRAKYQIVVVGVLILLCAAYNSKYMYSTMMCSMQEYIYPGLRLLRRISIPLISLFPSLTDLYHETCLIQNPFFTVVDMDCWPCSTVISVREIYDPKPVNQQNGAPFIYETDQQIITIDKLKSIYVRNKDNFDKESPRILVNNKYYISPQDMFLSEQMKDEKNFYIWRFNNMDTARLLRQVIQRPKVVPKFGQSTERFIIVDNSQQSFQVPDTECSYSFLLALSGSRTVDLVPAEECKNQCKTLKVELKETYLCRIFNRGLCPGASCPSGSIYPFGGLSYSLVNITAGLAYHFDQYGTTGGTGDLWYKHLQATQLLLHT